MYKVLILLILLLLLLLLTNSGEKYKVLTPIDDAQLDTHGYTVLRNVLTPLELHECLSESKNGKVEPIKKLVTYSPLINRRILKTLGNQYRFHDYIWLINKSTVHTFHRDNNATFFNDGQRYKSYTMIIYLKDMNECLDVMEGSHTSLKSNCVNLNPPVRTLKVEKGDAILFDAGLIHAGTILESQDNPRIQLKVSHKDDMDKLSYYQDFNKIINEENPLPSTLKKVQKHLTAVFPFISDATQRVNINSARGSSKGATVPLSQKIFSMLFYGKSDFYDLKDG